MDDTPQDANRRRPDDGLPDGKTQTAQTATPLPAGRGELWSTGFSDQPRQRTSGSPMKLLALILLLLLNAFLVHAFKKQAPPASPATANTAAEPQNASHPPARS